jgi:non-specific serine/threonine protein kinase
MLREHDSTPSTGKAIAAQRTAFGHQVRGALAHLHDPASLQVHPVTRTLDPPPGTRPSDLGRYLRQRLIEAIDSLRPDPKVTPDSPAWRSYQILTLRYVEGWMVAAVVEKLAVSRSQYFIDQRKATDAVAALLWERWVQTSWAELSRREEVDRDERSTLLPQVGPTLAAVPRLPRPLTSFVGRVGELAEVKRLLQEFPLVTLTGPGGCGKTRLALQVAADVHPEYRDGVWVVELAALGDAALVPDAVAGVLGVREQPRQMLDITLVDALRDRHALLVFDNCEHVLDACARLVEALLQSCLQLRVLATSREALVIAGEVAWPVPVLAMPASDKAVSLEDLHRWDATRLFLDRARAAQPSLVLSDADVPILARICARLDGLPFALELAAAQLRVLSVAQLAARLDDRFQILTRGSRTALPRQQTLRATIDWSYDLLDEPERILFRRLAVFAGGWTLEAAEAVAGVGSQVSGVGEGTRGPDPQHPTPGTHSILGLLARLVDQSLVIAERSGEEASRGRGSDPTAVRFRMLETIGAYAAEKLRTSGEEDLLRARHRDWYLAFAERADAALAGPDQVAVLRQMKAEHDNFRAALAWCKQPDQAEIGLRLASGLAQFWSINGHYGEGRTVLAKLLHLAPRPDESPDAEARAARSRALVAAGSLASRQGDYEIARSFLGEGLAIARALQDQLGIATALAESGAIPIGETAMGDALLVEALTHAQQAADPTLTQRILLRLADRVVGHGDLERAQQLAGESLSLTRRLGDARGSAAALSCLGWVTFLLGQPGAALTLIEESLATMETVGDREGMEEALLRRALIARIQGDDELARASREQSLALAREVGDRARIGWSLYGLAWIAHDADDLVQARALFAECLTLFRTLGHEGGICRALVGLGRVMRGLGDDVAARGYLEESLPIWRALPNQRDLAEALWSLGLAAYGQGDLGAARAWLAESLGLWRGLGDHRGIAEALEELGVVAEARGRARLALRLVAAALALREEMGATLSPIRQARLDRRLEQARRLLDGAEAEAARLAGRSMTAESVIATALERGAEL